MDSESDAIWILSSTFIVFTMQSGFGLLESGSVSVKNELNIMVKNAVDVVFGGLTYWMFGYGLSFGDSKYSNPFSGWGYFFVNANDDKLGIIYSKFFFQASFATTATTIVSGAMAERTKLTSYMLFSMFNTLLFCIPAHWVWASNGWLYRFGVVDIAGAGPVHIVGGVTGLVATLMLKPRHGRYVGRTSRIPQMSSPTNAVLGMFMLWWGWLGFNCGSTFGISGLKWKLAARSAATTLCSSVAGGVGGFLLSYIVKNRIFDVTYMINGLLGSLVSITEIQNIPMLYMLWKMRLHGCAGLSGSILVANTKGWFSHSEANLYITAVCAIVQPWEGLVIGFVGSIISNAGVALLDKLRVDDPVGCVGTHALSGFWGMLVAGLFIREDDLLEALYLQGATAGAFHGGGFRQLGVQTLAIVAIAVWTLVMSFIILKLIDLTLGLRVPLIEEIIGADIVEHGIGDMVYDRKTKTLKPPLKGTVQDPLTNGHQNMRGRASAPRRSLLGHTRRRRTISEISTDLIREEDQPSASLNFTLPIEEHLGSSSNVIDLENLSTEKEQSSNSFFFLTRIRERLLRRHSSKTFNGRFDHNGNSSIVNIELDNVNSHGGRLRASSLQFSPYTNGYNDFIDCGSSFSGYESSSGGHPSTNTISLDTSNTDLAESLETHHENNIHSNEITHF